MNIDQWLDDIDPVAQLDNSDQLNARHGITIYQRVQRSHESSPLRPVIAYTLKARSEKYTSSSSDSNLGSASVTTSPSVSTLSSHRYRKKARRRTRKDKYEPKKRKPSREHKRRSKKVRKKDSKRRKRNRDNNKHVAGVVQSFQAKNIPPKSRLTFKPSKVGLYTNGRASEPVKGRGLPDLVFSEMRFLQKREVNVEKEQSRSAKKDNKKKRSRKQPEEEISAYFDFDKGQKSRPRPDQDDRTNGALQTTEHSLEKPSTPSVVESPDKATLRIGSKGNTARTMSYCDKNPPKSLVPFRSCLEDFKVGQLDNLDTIRSPAELIMSDKGPATGPLKEALQPPPVFSQAQTIQEPQETVSENMNTNQVAVGSVRDLRRSGPRDIEVEAAGVTGNQSIQHRKWKTVDDIKDQRNDMRVADDSWCRRPDGTGPGHDHDPGISPSPREKPRTRHDPEELSSSIAMLLNECGQTAFTSLPAYRKPRPELPPYLNSHQENSRHLWKTVEKQELGPYDHDTEAYMDPSRYPARPELEDLFEQSAPEDVLTESCDFYSLEPQLYCRDQYDGELMHDEMPDQELATNVRFDSVSFADDGEDNRDDYQSEGLSEFWRPNRLY